MRLTKKPTTSKKLIRYEWMNDFQQEPTEKPKRRTKAHNAKEIASEWTRFGRKINKFVAYKMCILHICMGVSHKWFKRLWIRPITSDFFVNFFILVDAAVAVVAAVLPLLLASFVDAVFTALHRQKSRTTEDSVESSIKF